MRVRMTPSLVIGVCLVAAGVVGLSLSGHSPAAADLPLGGGWHVTLFWPVVSALASVAAGAVLLMIAGRRRMRSSRG